MSLENEPMEVPKDFSELYGVRIYGKELEQTTVEDMEKIESNSTSEIHLARHYKNLPEGYKNSLLGQAFEYYDPKEQAQKTSEITAEKVQSALDVIGSKFLDNLELLTKYDIETPTKLIELIKQKAIEQALTGRLTWFDAGFCKKAYLQIDLPEQIGYDNVVPVVEVDTSDLDQQIRGKLEGDDFKVNVANNHPGKLTKKISVIIGCDKEKGASPAIFMAHPGNHTPDFPKDQQNQEEKEYNKIFGKTMLLLYNLN